MSREPISPPIRNRGPYHSSRRRSTTPPARALAGPVQAATAWVALGANLGDPAAALARARRWLAATPGIRLVASSRVHVTAPVGPPQPPYLNAVVRLATRLPPRALLAALQRMERAAGRVRGLRWGPRTLDLDLLMYADRVSDDPVLTLPHPRLHERGFVLDPLCELDPDLRHPRLGRTMAELRGQLTRG